jgi:hypothetical protein
MNRVVTLLVSVVLLVGLVAAPAVANPPERFGPFTDVIDGVDPCTGEDHQLTIIWTISVKETDDTFTGRVRMSGTTSAGYTMVDSRHIVKDAPNGFKDVNYELWWNESTGDVYEFNGVFYFSEASGMVVDEVTLTCLTGPTFP